MKKTGVDPCTVKFYDVGDETLTTRSIGEVYGVTNLYRDARNTEDVNEIEKKLSNLESAAATIIRNLHTGLPNSDISNATFSISREETETLRKFLFIMHLRNERIAKTVFDPEHPENLIGRKRMLHMQKKLGLGSPTDMWLHFLRYYLDTPHTQILLHAVESIRNFPSGLGLGQDFELDPDWEHFEAMVYQQQANMYYLGIWRAAPGHEFVLGHNSFGLWEGIGEQTVQLHKIFIVSPQIAIILRSNYLRPEQGGEKFRTMCHSAFVDFPLPPARPTYVSGLDGLYVEDPKATDSAPVAMANSVLSLASQHNPRDRFEFPITSLTLDKTHKVNYILLYNVHRTGSVTFLSEPSMLEAARRYETDFGIRLCQADGKVKALIHHLERREAANKEEKAFVLDHYLEKWSRRQKAFIGKESVNYENPAKPK